MEEKYDKSLEELFSNPPNEFRMMPFWFWNHEMVEKEVQRQITDHFTHGIGGEFVHPRHGRLTPYMGRRWLENVEAAADKCRELGGYCFLYDEDNWPSGPVSGKITGPYRPENRGKFLTLFDEEVFEPGEEVDYPLDYKKVDPDAEFYTAIAVPNPEDYPNFSKVADEAINVGNFVENDTFKWKVPDDGREWTVLFFCIMYNSYNADLNGYIDPLRKETVNEFIRETHKKYVEWFISRGKRDYLGTVVPGIFTDEPSMDHNSSPGRGFMKYVPFTHELPDRFREMFGYDFNEALLSLFYETGDISAKHRCDFGKCVTEMYRDAYFRQIYEYCDKYGLRTTGHVNAEGTFPAHIYNQGDFFKIFEYMHYAGCDQLTDDIRPDGFERVVNLKGNPYTGMANEMLVASKLASSVAYLMNKPRVLVEAFGSASWDMRLADCKRVSDYLVITGCDLFVPHDFAYSEDGYRKQDHPPSFYHQPYYKHWRRLADYTARLCTLFNAHSGKPVQTALLLYPAKTIYAESCPRATEPTRLVGNMFNFSADCLLRQQLDFSIAPDEFISAAEIRDGKISINGLDFEILIMGAATCITPNMHNFLKKYIENGGKIIFSGYLPFKRTDVGRSDELISFMKDLFGIDPEEIYRNTPTGEKECVIYKSEKENAYFIGIPRMEPWKTDFQDKFEEVCRNLIPPDNRDIAVYRKDENVGYRFHAGYVSTLHKIIEGRHFYLIANTSRYAEYYDAKIVLGIGAAEIRLWNPENGTVESFTGYRIKDGKTEIIVDLPPHTSYVFEVVPLNKDNSADIGETGKVPQKMPKKVPHPLTSKPITVIDPGKRWKCGITDPNCAMLYRDWHAEFAIEAERKWRYRSTRRFIHKFTVRNAEEIKKKPVKLIIEGITGDYAWGKWTYDTLRGGDRAHVSLDGLSFYVNGKRLAINFDFDFIYLDPGWIVADITDYIKEGENTVEMVCSTGNHATFHTVTDPWRIIGYFAVNEDKPIPELYPIPDYVELGDIGESGFPRYHGGFIYENDILISGELKDRRFILIVENTADCIEVEINGKPHEVLWYKWWTDITDKIEVGKSNRIKIIHYGTAQNIMQTNRKPSGINGPIKIGVYYGVSRK